MPSWAFLQLSRDVAAYMVRSVIEMPRGPETRRCTGVGSATWSKQTSFPASWCVLRVKVARRSSSPRKGHRRVPSGFVRQAAFAEGERLAGATGSMCGGGPHR